MINGISSANATYGAYGASNGSGATVNIDFDGKIITKGQCKLSDAEFSDMVLAINKREVETGKRSRNSAEWNRLVGDYMSKASLDRAGIISSTLMGLKSRLGMMFRPGKSLLNTILGNHRMFRSRDVGDNFINFKDSSGTLIAIYSSDTGWSTCPTDAELARQRKFTIMWDKARVKAAQIVGETNSIIDMCVDGFNPQMAKALPYDMEKLAAHGIAYDAEAGRAVVVDKAKLEQATGRQVMDTPTMRN